MSQGGEAEPCPHSVTAPSLTGMTDNKPSPVLTGEPHSQPRQLSWMLHPCVGVLAACWEFRFFDCGEEEPLMLHHTKSPQPLLPLGSTPAALRLVCSSVPPPCTGQAPAGLSHTAGTSLHKRLLLGSRRCHSREPRSAGAVPGPVRLC